VALGADWRGRGLGTALIAFAERRILREVPNVFLCVSSFNTRARTLYLRLGYEVVGELRDYIVRGHSEWLLRKSVAPLAEFTPAAPLGTMPQSTLEGPPNRSPDNDCARHPYDGPRRQPTRSRPTRGIVTCPLVDLGQGRTALVRTLATPPAAAAGGLRARALNVCR
jgi:hypothetical protein